MSDVAPLDPERMITALSRHAVSYVLIGALAARLHGFPRVTAGIDITPEPDDGNLARLAAALRERNARVFTESVPAGLPFDCSAKTLRGAAMWNLVTDAGRMDVAFLPSGTEGFGDLVIHAERFHVFGAEILVASLPDIIRSKSAANRPQDRQDVPVLRAILARQQKAR